MIELSLEDKRKASAAMNAVFVAVDGVNGTGKSTQVGRLVKWLRDLKTEVATADGAADQLAPDCGVEVVREPGGTVSGEQIRALLINPDRPALDTRAEALLFMAARAQLVAERVRPLCRAGYCVVADRWVSSTFGYQHGHGDLPLDDVVDLYDFAIPDYADRPHLVVVLDAPAVVAEARTKGRGDTSNRFYNWTADQYEKVRDGYQAFLDEYPSSAVRVDAAGSPDEVFDGLLKAVLDRFLYKAKRVR